MPERILERSLFRNTEITYGLLISRSGTDENILPGTSEKKTKVALHLLRFKGNEIANAIKVKTFDAAEHRLLIIDVGNDAMHVIWKLAKTIAPVEQPKLPTVILRNKLSHS